MENENKAIITLPENVTENIKILAAPFLASLAAIMPWYSTIIGAFSGLSTPGGIAYFILALIAIRAILFIPEKTKKAKWVLIIGVIMLFLIMGITQIMEDNITQMNHTQKRWEEFSGINLW